MARIFRQLRTRFPNFPPKFRKSAKQCTVKMNPENKILVKKISLAVSVFLTAGVFGFLFNRLLVAGTLPPLVAFTVSGAVFLAIFLIQVLLVQDFWVNFLIVVTSI